MENLADWIGRSEDGADAVDPRHIATLAATLNRDALPEGAALPPLWHWSLFRPLAPSAQIGTDGHPRLGGFMPPIPYPRRMWVGGRIDFVRPLCVGAKVARKTTITDVTEKSGRSGGLIFVTLRHEVSDDAGIAITEEQDLVYRPAVAVAAPPPAPTEQAERQTADWRIPMTPDPVLLFRFSAATFNGHRIHYDEAYARNEEGYRGLVVHGPLTATLLGERLAQNCPQPVTRFEFRARQPLFCNEPLAICGRKTGDRSFDLWAETPNGEVAMSATAGVAA